MWLLLFSFAYRRRQSVRDGQQQLRSAGTGQQVVDESAGLFKVLARHSSHANFLRRLSFDGAHRFWQHIFVRKKRVGQLTHSIG